MKAVKMFLGMMLCLVVLAGQVQATTTTLNFDGVTDLADYGKDNGVTFTGWDGVLASATGGSLQDTLFFGPNTTASNKFSTSAYLVSFDYEVLTFGGKAYLNADKEYELINSGTFVASSSSLASVLLSEISFTLKDGATLFRVDNLSFTPTPLPGAALFFGAGLLGLVGLRRRQTT